MPTCLDPVTNILIPNCEISDNLLCIGEACMKKMKDLEDIYDILWSYAPKYEANKTEIDNEECPVNYYNDI